MWGCTHNTKLPQCISSCELAQKVGVYYPEMGGKCTTKELESFQYCDAGDFSYATLNDKLLAIYRDDIEIYQDKFNGGYGIQLLDDNPNIEILNKNSQILLSYIKYDGINRKISIQNKSGDEYTDYNLDLIFDLKLESKENGGGAYLYYQGKWRRFYKKCIKVKDKFLPVSHENYKYQVNENGKCDKKVEDELKVIQ